MINYFFIFDNNKQIQVKLPVLSENQYLDLTKHIINNYLTNALFGNNQFEKINFQHEVFNVFINKISSGDCLVCISKKNIDTPNRIWQVMNQISKEIEQKELKESDNYQVKNEIAIRNLDPLFEKVNLDYINTKALTIENKLDKLKRDGLSNLTNLSDAFEIADSTDKKAALINSGTLEIKKHYWWENKKLLIIFGVIFILSLAFILFLALK